MPQTADSPAAQVARQEVDDWIDRVRERLDEIQDAQGLGHTMRVVYGARLLRSDAEHLERAGMQYWRHRGSPARAKGGG